MKNQGTDSIEEFRLPMPVSEIENLTMGEDEKITQLHLKVCFVTNEIFSLGEACSIKKLVNKVIKSLSKRFKSKVAAIEE